MEFRSPRLVDEIDNRFMLSIGCGREVTAWFVQENDTSGICLERFSRCTQKVELPNGQGAIADGYSVEINLSIME